MEPKVPVSEAELRRLRRFGQVLDNAIPLPGGYRIGLEGIVGLVPGVGDGLGALASAYIIAYAARLGVPTLTLAQMIWNAGIDLLIGVVPLLGDLFDFAWKANLRNIALLEEHAGRASRGHSGDRRLAALVVVLVLLMAVLILALTWWLLQAIAGLFTG